MYYWEDDLLGDIYLCIICRVILMMLCFSGMTMKTMMKRDHGNHWYLQIVWLVDCRTTHRRLVEIVDVEQLVIYTHIILPSFSVFMLSLYYITIEPNPLLHVNSYTGLIITFLLLCIERLLVLYKASRYRYTDILIYWYTDSLKFSLLLTLILIVLLYFWWAVAHSYSRFERKYYNKCINRS